MDDSTLQAIVKNQMEDALNYYDSELSSFRIDVQDYYNSEEFGNEQSGKSEISCRPRGHSIEVSSPRG